MRSGRRIRVLVGCCLAGISLPFLISGLLQYRASIWWMEARELDCGEEVAAGRALEIYREARARLDWNGWFLADYGNCLEEAGRLDEAIRAYQKATRQRADPYALEKLADLYARNGALAAAIEAAETASLMLPWRLTSKAQLMTFHAEAGNAKRARVYARELLLTPMKVSSVRGVRLKQKARRYLARGPVSGLSPGPHEADGLNLVPEPWQRRIAEALEIAGENGSEWVRALHRVPEASRQDLVFLIANMPEADLATMTADFLLSDLEAARQSRHLFPFLEDVPDGIFRDYVLPYPQTADKYAAWRVGLRRKAAPLVSELESLDDAILALKQGLPELFGVGCGDPPTLSQPTREPVSPVGCLEVSTLFVDVLRSLGIASRLVLIPCWKGGNAGYAWAEVYVRGHWRSIGVDDASRLDDSWFHDRASQTDPSREENRIYAVSFARTDLNLDQYGADVWWDDITDRYTTSAVAPPAPGAGRDEEAKQ